MNRIILIGNGFDLAHGMPTSYNDFINDYWKSNIIEIKKKSGSDIFENEDFIIEKVPSEWDIENTFPALIKHLLRNKTKIKFKNRFLRIITSKKYQQNQSNPF